ncbi:unnamed protein product, partial [Gulo gulo]
GSIPGPRDHNLNKGNHLTHCATQAPPAHKFYQDYLLLPIMGHIPIGTALCPGAQMYGMWEADLGTTLSCWTPSLCEEVKGHLSTPPHFKGFITSLLGRKGRTHWYKKGGITKQLVEAEMEPPP